jgi:hypothetical protein
MSRTRIRIATAAVIVAATATTTPAPSLASVDPALNGRYTATSDGEWAKTNESFHDEATVVSDWTITSSCTGAYDCKGTVASDSGWTTELVYISGMWLVTRVVNDWMRCADGTTAPGKQIIKFSEDRHAKGSYVGWDTTAGPSGACGVNRPLFIEIPFTLVPIP